MLYLLPKTYIELRCFSSLLFNFIKVINRTYDVYTESFQRSHVISSPDDCHTKSPT